MRLIDADALQDYIESDDSGLCAAREFQRDYIACIDDMPTIDPVKHGHWIIGDWHKCDEVYPNQGRKCSRCFRTCHITQVPWDATFCPWCGAKMDEEAEE